MSDEGRRDWDSISLAGMMWHAQGHADRNTNGNERQEIRRYLDPCDSPGV